MGSKDNEVYEALAMLIIGIASDEQTKNSPELIKAVSNLYDVFKN